MPRSKEDGAARKRKERSVAALSVKEGDAECKRVTRPVAAQVAAQQKRTVQGAVFPTSGARSKRPVAAQEQNSRDAARKQVTRSVTAQVAAQQKRTVQGAMFPTSDADKGFCPSILQGQG